MTRIEYRRLRSAARYAMYRIARATETDSGDMRELDRLWANRHIAVGRVPGGMSQFFNDPLCLPVRYRLRRAQEGRHLARAAA